ncbi:MAG: 1-deoxy-D-xylulose-5-phosphate reductoisomerase [Candidatus Cloacimonadaceae bacterium]|jgi:1-deoxy-D-xylulose-5-phosphate reductoisomerase|nr:1-deoxy-D-xylulose-5-phosphate reductoisomerase [Candidatus Cloacimonadaceae bacterium]
MVKKIALLGATGSIGDSFFKVYKEHKASIKISFAAAHSNVAKLCELATTYKIPQISFTGIEESSTQRMIRNQYPQIKIYFGKESLLSLLAEEDYDIGLNAIGGSAGIEATFAILNKGVRLALANKESLVMGGHLVQKLRQPGQIIPIDSEHSAIFQALGKHPRNEVQKLIITASGGAFRTLDLAEFIHITPQMALKHPNWDMGAKVTLDSATMFNKALEVMEAHWLFDLDYDQIEAVIHPQSIIHSMVQYIDGSILAQMSSPDMSLPILYALSYPERWQSSLVQTDLIAKPDLSFDHICPERFPLFYLGLEAARQGGIFPTAINAAVEAAMKLFLEAQISFPQIYTLVEKTLGSTTQIAEPDLDTIIRANKEYYYKCLALI